MDIKSRVSAFVHLGHIIREKLQAGLLAAELEQAYQQNNWFTIENSKRAIYSILDNFLDSTKIENWLKPYHLPDENLTPRTVGIVMAGNIPLVGWQDLQCVLISGNKAMIKLSSKDTVLMKLFIRELIHAEPSFKNDIQYKEQLKDFDAVIATGSDNTNRYFEYYFGKFPHILRRNRNSIGILTGNESESELKALGSDIFSYFGLGCRNVSKLFVPEGYDFKAFFNAIENRSDILMHKKYANNYEYNKSLLLLNKEKHLDNGFLLLKESATLSTPVSVLNYQFYNSIEDLKRNTENEMENIQCIAATPGIIANSINFGETQNPALEDYADGVDVMRFLEELI